MSLHFFPAASLSRHSELIWGGYRGANDEFVPLSNAGCAPTICSRDHAGLPYIPTDCYSPLADGKRHYIIKGIGGNNLGFFPAIVLTWNSPFDVIKIYVERQTVNMCLPNENKYIFILCRLLFAFLLGLNILQLVSGKCRYHTCHRGSACYSILHYSCLIFPFCVCRAEDVMLSAE